MRCLVQEGQIVKKGTFLPQMTFHCMAGQVKYLQILPEQTYGTRG